MAEQVFFLASETQHTEVAALQAACESGLPPRFLQDGSGAKERMIW